MEGCERDGYEDRWRLMMEGGERKRVDKRLKESGRQMTERKRWGA